LIKKLLIYIFLFIGVTDSVYAKKISVNYEARFGLLGKVGAIYNTIDINNGRYTINTTLKLYGVAKMLLGNQKEHYISKGKVVDGMFLPEFYSMSTIKKHKKMLKEYHFDHKTHKLVRIKKKWRNGKLTSDEKKIVNFYAKDDLLTLYFNMDKHIKDHKAKHSFNLMVAGLERQNGKVKITVASLKDKKKYQDELGNSASWYAKAHIVQKSFKNKSGDILLSISKDRYIQTAVIKDLVMYGDAVLKRK